MLSKFIFGPDNDSRGNSSCTEQGEDSKPLIISYASKNLSHALSVQAGEKPECQDQSRQREEYNGHSFESRSSIGIGS